MNIGRGIGCGMMCALFAYAITFKLFLGVLGMPTGGWTAIIIALIIGIVAGVQWSGSP